MKFFLGSICTDPDAMRILLYVNNLLTIVKIGLPLAIIIYSSIDFFKTVTEANFDNFKKQTTKLVYRLLSAVIVFFVPLVINVIFGFVDDKVDVIACFENATKDNIILAYMRQADLELVKAEASLKKSDYDEAARLISQLEDGNTKNNYLSRLEILRKTIEDKNKSNSSIWSRPISGSSESISGSGSLKVSGSYSSSGNAKMGGGIELTREPDPSTAINYWKYVDTANFVYPRDSATGLPLGAWPKDYSSYPTQLTNYRVYKNEFIFPVTPVSGTYNYVYEHNGIDLMANFGTPVYSPVDGTLQYSEWGHTKNKGSDETAYTVSIYLDRPVTISNVKVGTVFLTHMCGLRYRCVSVSNCNRKIKKGELLGFVGNATGSSTSVGWAPHLHMSLYPKGHYKSGLRTTKIQNEIYGIASGTDIRAGG